MSNQDISVELQKIIEAARDGGYGNRVSREISEDQALNIYRRGKEIEEETIDYWYDDE